MSYNYNINRIINRNLIIIEDLNINSNTNIIKKMLIGKEKKKLIK